MVKRAFDIIAAGLGLIVLSPLFLALALLIKIASPGPIFYRDQRVGQYGKIFLLYKFRSMIVNAHRIGPAVTGAQDTRITPIGRFLRKTKLDEVPQLLNVLLGDMSLVGPRPEAPRYVEFYTEEQRQVLTVRPGITSPASIRFRHEEGLLVGEDWETYYIQTVMPQKLAIDLEYVENISLTNDLRIILRTIISLFEQAD